MIARVEGVVALAMNQTVPVKINTDWLTIFGSDQTLIKSPFERKS